VKKIILYPWRSNNRIFPKCAAQIGDQKRNASRNIEERNMIGKKRYPQPFPHDKASAVANWRENFGFWILDQINLKSAIQNPKWPFLCKCVCPVPHDHQTEANFANNPTHTSKSTIFRSKPNIRISQRSEPTARHPRSMPNQADKIPGLSKWHIYPTVPADTMPLQPHIGKTFI
jgi:hypothetical protein